MKKFCPKCGTNNVNEAKYCEKCGNELYIKNNDKLSTKKKNDLINSVNSIKWIIILPLAFIMGIILGTSFSIPIQIVTMGLIAGFSGYIVGGRSAGTMNGFATGAIGLFFGTLMQGSSFGSAFLGGIILGGGLGAVFGAFGGYIKEDRFR